MQLFKATGIVWDTDGSDFKIVGLPETAYVHTDDEDEIADLLSDEFGFCINTLTIEPVTGPCVFAG